MSELAALASLKFVEVRNRGRLFSRQSRFKVLVITAFSIAFWFALFYIFYVGISRLDEMAGGLAFEGLVERMFYIFFFALTVMLIFSNAIIGYSSYFKSKETGFLLSQPVRPESIFLYKFFESLSFSSWAVVFLGTPLMAAYGRHVGVEWHFYITSTLVLVAYMMIPAAIGGIVVMLVAVAWFFVGLHLGYIFFYPPVMFVLGFLAFVKGLAG